MMKGDPLNLRLMSMSPDNGKKADDLRLAYVALSNQIMSDVPATRERALACTNLEQSLQWAIKSLCVDSPENRE